MPACNRDTWMKRFATKLLTLHPTTTAEKAARAAADAFERLSVFEPETVASAFDFEDRDETVVRRPSRAG